MKTLATLLLTLISTFVLSQDYKVVQINATWNEHNKIKLPNKIEDATTVYGLLENQGKALQEQIQAVPIIILFKDNKPIRQWSADLSFKLKVDINEIAYAIREDKQKTYRRKTN